MNGTGAVRVRVSVPHLAKMRRASTFEEFNAALPGDHVYSCHLLFEAVTGRELHILTEQSLDVWREFRQLIDALADAAETLEFALAAGGVFASAEDRAAATSRLLAQMRAIEPEPETGLFHSCLSQLFEDLVMAARFGSMQPGVALPLLHGLVHLDTEALDGLAPLSDTLGVFISYKQKAYSADASALYDELEARGISSWLDRKSLSLTTPEGGVYDRRLLHRALRRAVEHARCTVFFETYSYAHADEDARGGHIQYNWQMFEWRYASRIVLVSPQRRAVEFLVERTQLPFIDIPTLASALADYVGRLPARTAGDHVGPARSYPPLQECSARLRTFVRNYFERHIQLTTITTLALLCPGEADGKGNQAVTLSDDVLVRLARLSPYCALHLARAGLDLHELFRVGTKLTTAPWRMPGDFLLKDLLGLDDRVPQAAEIGARGELDEAALMNALLEMACQKGFAANRLLTRVLRNQHGISDSVSVSSLLEGAREGFAASVSRPPSQSSDLGWLIGYDGSTWTIRSFACAGVYDIKAAAVDPVRVSINAVSAADGFLGDLGTNALADLLATTPETSAIEAFFDEQPNLFMLLENLTPMVSTTFEIPDGSIFMLPDEVVDDSIRQDEVATFAQRFVAAADAVRLSASSPAPDAGKLGALGGLLVPLRARRVVLLQRSREAQPAAEPIPLLELQRSVLTPLWRYAGARELEFDAFDL